MPHAPVHRHPLVFVSLLFLAGCAKSPQEKLAGKWVGERIDNVSADQVARATGWVKGTTFEFAGDKITVTVPAETARKGTYKVAQADGEKLVLSIARADTPSTDEAKLTLLDEKSMRWEIGQGREVLLVRASQ